MTVFTEGRHAAEAILSEASGQRSRENGVAGADLVANQVCEIDDGALVPFDPDATNAAPAVMVLYNVKSGDPVAYLARDAEVNVNVLTFPEESTEGGERAAAIAALAQSNIHAR